MTPPANPYGKFTRAEIEFRYYATAAVQKHLRNLMPKDNPWPNTDQASLTRFYGAAGDEDRLCDLIVDGLGVKYEGAAVRTIRCNRKIAGSLLRIIKKLSLSHPYVLADYNGCYNNRSMRGGSLPSLHARGAAIDFLAGENGNKTSWPAKATMPLEVMEIFAIEGVLSPVYPTGRAGKDHEYRNDIAALPVGIRQLLSFFRIT